MPNPFRALPKAEPGKRYYLTGETARQFTDMLTWFANIVGAGTVNVQNSANGPIIVGNPSPASASATPSGTPALSRYTVLSVGDDILKVQDIYGNTQYVAKAWQCQRSPFDGNTVGGVSYSYVNSTTRTAVLSGTSESQILTPSWVTSSEVIVAGSLSTPFAPSTSADKTLCGNSVITLVDLNNSAHEWAIAP